MPSLSCLTIFEPGALGSNPGNVVVPSTEVPFPVEAMAVGAAAFAFDGAAQSLSILIGAGSASFAFAGAGVGLSDAAAAGAASFAFDALGDATTDGMFTEDGDTMITEDGDTMIEEG